MCNYEINKQDGFVFMFRSIRRWGWKKNPLMVAFFVELLTAATYKDREVNGIQIKRGQLLTSINRLVENTGLSKQQVRLCIKRLISTHEITHQTTHRYSIITIINFDRYQQGTQDSNTVNNTVNNTLATQSQHSDNTVATLYNKEINKKRNKEITKNPPCPPTGGTSPKKKSAQPKIIPPPEIASTFNTWIDYRRQIKKPLKPPSQKTIIKKYSGKPQEFAAAVEHSISNGYQGLFEPKNVISLQSRQDREKAEFQAMLKRTAEEMQEC